MDKEKDLEDFLKTQFGIDARVLNMGEMFKPKEPPKKICDLTPEEQAEMEIINSKIEATQKRFDEEGRKLKAEKDLWWLKVQQAHNTFAYDKFHVHDGALYTGLKHPGCICGTCK